MDRMTRLTGRIRDERGMALLIAVILLLLMSALGVAALQHAGDEASGSGRSRRKDATLYAAEAGQAMAQARWYQSTQAMSSGEMTIDEPALVTDAYGNPIAVRSGVPSASGLPTSPANLDDKLKTGKGAVPSRDGFMLNQQGPNTWNFRVVRADIVAQDSGNGLVHLLAQYSLMEK